MFSWLFNFTWLAKFSTSRAPLFKGLLPTLGTLFTLLAISLVVAAGIGLWAGTLATLSAFIPVYLKTIAGITGAALLNFWFARDITTGALNCREALAIDDVHEETNDPTHLYDLVNHVRHELSAYFTKCDLVLMSALLKNGIPEDGKMYLQKEKGVLKYIVKTPDGKVVHDTLDINVAKLTPEALKKLRNKILTKAHERGHVVKVDLPMPRICTYTSDAIKLHTVFGTSPENAAMFFSSSFLNSMRTGWDKRHIAALVAHQMVQIHQRRGWSGTISSIATNFLSTLESFQESSQWYYRLLGMLAGPLQFFYLVQKSIERSYSMAAITEVIGAGRGYDFFNAIDIKVSPSKTKKPASPSHLMYYKEMKKRKPYDGWFAGIVRFFTDKMDDLEWIEDDKTGYRIISFIRSLVREIIFSWQELTGEDKDTKRSGNRTTREKDHIRESMKIGRVFKALPPRVSSKTFQDVMDTLVQQRLIDPISPEEFAAKLREVKWGSKLSKQPIQTLLNKPWKDFPDQEFHAMLSVVCEAEMLMLDKKDRKINAALYNQIPEAEHYKTIGPNKDGHKTPIYQSPQSIRLSKLKEKLKNLNGSRNDDDHKEVLSRKPKIIINKPSKKQTATTQHPQRKKRMRGA